MGGYTAEARGIAGAISWGKTLVHAKEKVVEAIEGAIEARAIAHAEEQGMVRVIVRPPQFKFA
jgi:predicted RNase H-like HicB family nuclease